MVGCFFFLLFKIKSHSNRVNTHPPHTSVNRNYFSLSFFFFNFQLHKTDPKPENAMQFIRKRLTTEAIDPEEFHSMKQCLSKLNEDVGEMKANMTKISNLVSKLLPDTANNDIDLSVNTSVPSMENNCGDASHLTALDDSSMIFDETVVNANELNATMHTDDFSGDQSTRIDEPDASHSKGVHGTVDFTMEIVEVDVVSKSMLNSSMLNLSNENQENEKVIEEIPMEIVSESMMTSTRMKCDVEHEIHASGSNIGIKIEDLPIVFKDDSQEQL